MEVVLIQLLSYKVVSKQKKIKMKAQNVMICSYHSKVTSTQNKVVLFFFLFGSWSLVRSSHPELFCRGNVLRNFAKFTGKHLCQSLFFNKVADLRPATLLKRDSGTGIFK